MAQVRSTAVVILLLSYLAVSTGHARELRKHAPIETGEWCLVDELYAGPDGPALGNFLMRVKVKRHASRYSVEFWNVMPDNPQVLGAKVGGIRPRRDGMLEFAFTDGWENRGRARLDHHGKFTLEFLGGGTESNIDRNYGEYPLNRADCSSAAFRRGAG